MPWPWWNPPCLRTVAVNLRSTDDEAPSGLLSEIHRRWLVLRRASIVKRDGSRLEVVGELWIPRDDVAYLQVMPDGDHHQ